MVGGWEMCTTVFSLLGCCYLSRITFEKNILWQRNGNCHVDVNSRVVWGLNVVRLLIRMVIDQSHDSNSAGGSSGTKGGGVHIIAQSGMNWFEYYLHPLPPPRSIFNFVAWLYSGISNQMIGVHTNSTSHAELHKLLLSKLYS